MITVCSLLFTKFAIFMYGIPNFIIRQNIHMYKYPPYKYSITCFMQSEVIYTIIAGLTKRKNPAWEPESALPQGYKRILLHSRWGGAYEGEMSYTVMH